MNKIVQNSEYIPVRNGSDILPPLNNLPQALEDTLGILVIEELNHKLRELAELIRDSLTEKNELRSDIDRIQNLLMDPQLGDEERKQLEAILDEKREALASLNTQSEVLTLTIQSLVSQRKEAMEFLSQMLASQHDAIMAIAKNLVS